MTKKCLWSFFTFSIFVAICIISMQLMLLAPLDEWVGVSIGSVILIFNFIFYSAFFRRKRGNVILLSLINAIGSGITMSSLYVYLGSAPTILQSVCIWLGFVFLFFIYCLLTNTSLLKNFPKRCLLIFGLLLLIGAIVGMCISSKIIFSFILMLLILFYAFLTTIVISTRNVHTHCHNILKSSFFILCIVIIVVLIVISQGDGLDGLDFPSAEKSSKTKKDPYEFIG